MTLRARATYTSADLLFVIAAMERRDTNAFHITEKNIVHREKHGSLPLYRNLKKSTLGL